MRGRDVLVQREASTENATPAITHTTAATVQMIQPRSQSQSMPRPT